MKFTKIVPLIVVIAALLAWGGCSSSNNNPVTPASSPDAQALKTAVQTTDSLNDFSASDELSIDDNGMEDPEYDGVMGASLSKDYPAGTTSTTDSIYPVRWGRRIYWNQIVRNYDVTMSGDTLATVMITKTIPGVFVVGWGTRSMGMVTIQDTVRKPFTETTRRKVLFRRIAHNPEPLRNWIPIAITMVDGKTDSINNFTIASVEVKDASLDTTVTDPLNQWFRFGFFRGCVPRIPVGDSVTVRVTVTSSDALPELVNLRHGIERLSMERRRIRMNLVSTSGGPGDYTRVYERTIRTGLGMHLFAARFNLVLDVLSNGSVYSMTAPFSNEFWGAPYIVYR